MLPTAVEVKAKEAIRKIEHGLFSENDIELLLIRLREYSNNSIFREISHFIAHHRRDSGITFLSLYKVYCRIRVLNEFQLQNKQLDLKLNTQIEKWFYDFVIFQLDEIESHVLKKKYSISKKQARKILKDSFSEEKGIYTCVIPPNQSLIDVISEASSFMIVRPVFSCNEIVSSFSDTFIDLGLVADSSAFEKQAEKFILRLLTLLHKREFHIGKDVIGNAYIDFPADGFGNPEALKLMGLIKIPGFANIIITLVETSLEYENWCESDLFVQRETNFKGHYWSVFDTSADLTVGTNNKLQRLVISN